MQQTVSMDAVMNVLRVITGYRDSVTSVHNQKQYYMTFELCRQFGLGDDDATLYAEAAELADIGKIGVSDGILMKAGLLTQTERKTMQGHTEMGYSILMLLGNSPEILKLANVALCHHEQWCGKGYPFRMTKDNIPIGARIVAPIDVTDALLSVRPYKEAWEPTKVWEYIKDNREIMFDPEICDCLLKSFDNILDARKKGLQRGWIIC